MRKIIMFLLLLVLAGCSITKNNNPVTSTQSATMTPFQPEIPVSVTTTDETTQTPLPTITTTPTATPDPYVIGFLQKSVDLSTGDLFISFYEGSLKEIILSTYLISPKNMGAYESLNDGFELDNNVVLIDPMTGDSIETHVSVVTPEKYGNLLVSVHSGGYNNTLLDAEKLRFYFERWGKNGDEYTLDQLTKIAGSKGTLYTNKLTLEIEALGGVRLGPDDSQKINKYPEKVVELILNSEPDTLGNKDLFEELKKSSDKHLLITFCGWGPDKNYSYYRYVILLKVLETKST